MRTIETVRRPGLEVAPDTTLRHAAETMERSNVGSLAVVDGDRLVGIVTDRDIVRRGVAKALDPTARIDGVMTSPVVTIDASADVHDAFALFRVHAVRRLAVVDGGRFVGMVTVDDLLMNLAGDLSDLARPVTAEVLFGHRDVPVPDAV
jgi:CBS domain-containing protein